MKRILLVIFIFILTVFPLSSCDFKDIDRRVFIAAMGLDYDQESKQIVVHLKAALAQEQAQAGALDQKNFKMFSTRDDSIGEALRKIKSQASREPDYSHMKIILLGEEFAKEYPLERVVDYVVRRRDFQNVAWVLVGRPTAESILKVQPIGERIAGNYLFMKFGQGVESQYIHETRSYGFYSDMITPGVTPLCPIVELKEQNFMINKAALFSDGKMKLELQKEETKLLKALTGEMDKGFFVMNHSKISDKLFGILVRSVKPRINLENPNEEIPNFSMEINVKALVEETSIPRNDSEVISTEFEKYIKKEVMDLMEKLQENEVDPLRLGAYYWMHHIDYEWNERWLTELYPRAKFDINVIVEVEGSGNLR